MVKRNRKCKSCYYFRPDCSTYSAGCELQLVHLDGNTLACEYWFKYNRHKDEKKDSEPEREMR